MTVALGIGGRAGNLRVVVGQVRVPGPERSRRKGRAGMTGLFGSPCSVSRVAARRLKPSSRQRITALLIRMSFSDPLLTKADVAELLRCCERTIERQVRDRAFPPPQKFGKQSLWFQSVVHDWLARRREEQQRWAQDLHMAEPAKGQSVVSLADRQADGRNQGRRAKPRSVTGLRASVFSDAELRAATRTLTEP